jgi:methylmalonyl-CoA epimerase
VAFRGIHHVGLAVADLDESIATYERLFGARLEHRELLAEDRVEVAVIRVGEDRIELLAAIEEDSPVGRFVSRRGPGIHHIAYEADDVQASLDELAGAGAELIDHAPRPGFLGLRVAFVHPDAVHGVLTEVVSGG